jgi:hypothetical protein
MGIHRGPNIVKDGLVFGYDTGYGVADNDAATRFYAGRNTINYLSSGVSNYNVVQDAAWSGATPTFTLGTSEFGTPIGTYTVGSTSYMYSYDQVLDDDLSTLSGQTVTWSVYLKRQGTSGNVGIRIYDNVSGYSTVYAAATLEFQRFSITKTLGANPTRIFVMIDNTGGGIIDFHSPQLEIGSEPSPFVDGTRSSTSSLIDLKRTTSIDVSNVSFDSTGQPTFDGSDDYISIDVDSWIRSVNSVTIEGVVIIPSGASLSGGPWAILTDHSTNSAKDGFWWHMSLGGGYTYFRVEDAVSGEQGITFSGATPFASGNTYHIVTIVGLNSVKIYVNGVLSKSYTPTFNWANVSASHTASLFIGRTFPSYWLNSTNPVVKVYDVALTEAEIKQNYNSYKNRFDI